VNDWPALRAARGHDAAARVRFHINDVPVGSVGREHLPALRAWPAWLHLEDDELVLRADAGALQAVLRDINDALRRQGLVRGWREELFPLYDPATLQPLARMERAATRFWGTLTLGAHATGYVSDSAGRPTHLWIAQRAFDKATDPGKFDNLIGGGVPDGQTPWQTLIREGWEEAGLSEALLRDAVAGPVLELRRDIPEGLQHERLYGYDLRLPAGLRPHNQDGEVAGFDCLPLAAALDLAAGDAMTVDAALVTLDFALRHALLPRPLMQRLDERMRALRVAPGVQSM
jgi:8-oxo-dGTP pyrophosphatase MutT (NUDIX family)